MERDRQQERPLDGVRQAYGWVMLFAQIGAVPVEAAMRKIGTMGSRYPTSWPFPVGMLAMGVVCYAAGPVGQTYAALVWALWILHIVRRNKAAHSMYCGRSGLGTGRRVYTAWEPIVFAAVGVGVMFLSPPTGLCMIASAVCSAVVFGHIEGRDRARLRAMRDAALEQEAIMAEFQRERGP